MQSVVSFQRNWNFAGIKPDTYVLSLNKLDGKLTRKFVKQYEEESHFIKRMSWNQAV